MLNKTYDKSPMPKNGAHIHVGGLCKKDSELEFATADLDTSNLKDLESFLQDEYSNSEGLVVIIIEPWGPWLEHALRKSFPKFPSNLTQALQAEAGAVAILPTLDDDGLGLGFVLDNIDIAPEEDQTSRSTAIELGLQKNALIQPIVAWARVRDGISAHPTRQLIILAVSQGQNSLSHITEHYFSNRSRWDRMQETPYWIYLDLFYIFTKWDKVLEAASNNESQAEISGFMRLGPIIERTNRLHRSIAAMIELREYIQIHLASMIQFQRRIRSLNLGRKITERLQDNISLLEHYGLRAQTIKEQLRNLMSLEFNIENVSQNQSVARLSVLAFIFIPLSYVAAIFGITTFTVEPQWYAVAAVPVLLCTIFVAWASSWILSWWDTYRIRRDSRLQEKLSTMILHEEPHSPVTDRITHRVSNESPPRRRSTESSPSQANPPKIIVDHPRSCHSSSSPEENRYCSTKHSDIDVESRAEGRTVIRDRDLAVRNYRRSRSPTLNYHGRSNVVVAERRSAGNQSQVARALRDMQDRAPSTYLNHL